jgi:HEAT repeat protein
LPRTALSSENPEVRAIAVSEGLADEDLEKFLTQDCPLPVVLAAVRRCPTDRLLALLSHNRWQVRSEALGVLSRGTDRPLKAVRTLTGSEDLGARAAAVELLLAWNDEEWLQDIFLPKTKMD